MGTKGDFFFQAASIKFISLLEFCWFEIDKNCLSNVGMDQISEKKRGKNKLKKAEDVVDGTPMDDMSDKKRGKNKLKSKKQEAEEHEEQLKRLKETVSCLIF